MEKLLSGLCHRCEHRASFLEKGHAPRCECGDTTCSVSSCYMYMPVLPVILERNKDDKRPQFAGCMISARSHIVRVPNKDDLSMQLETYKDGKMIYWCPAQKTRVKVSKDKVATKKTVTKKRRSE